MDGMWLMRSHFHTGNVTIFQTEMRCSACGLSTSYNSVFTQEHFNTFSHEDCYVQATLIKK